ncbi:hypothetical protein NFI96_018101 [Prochilodus magdalenae]|nr:hypothetical protein NFI96_018101 [Prochilodus magdalenae]
MSRPGSSAELAQVGLKVKPPCETTREQDPHRTTTEQVCCGCMDTIEAVGSRTPLGTLTPSQQNSEAKDADFSTLTPSHFGISTDSFLNFSKEKDKSRVAQLKSRRRSTVGVRGSPETNSLISFRAKAAMKTPPRTPSHILASPLFTGCDSIKQKMAAFQRLMEEDEENSEPPASLMTQEKQGEACAGGSLLKDVQSGTEATEEKMEDRLTPSRRRPSIKPPPSKKRRQVPRGLCEEEIQEEPLSDHKSSPTQEPGLHLPEFKSPEPKLGLGSDSQSQLMSFPMLSKPEVIRSDATEVSSVSKKKRVRFGAPLSPEFFDKTLPPSTPLQKGATPIRPPSSTGLKSLLKTPQRFDFPLPQPDFNSPGNNGASPVLSKSRCREREVECDEVFMDNEKISFSIMEDEFDDPPDDGKDAALAEVPELTPHNDPPTAGTELMDTGFREEEDLSSQITADHPLALPGEAEAESDLQLPESQQEQPPPASTTVAPRSRGRKRKTAAPHRTTCTQAVTTTVLNTTSPSPKVLQSQGWFSSLKPMMAPAQCHTRLSWSDSEWQRVIFTDESRFSLGGDAQRVCVWRHRCQHQDGRSVVTRPEDLVSLHLHPYRTICRNCQPAENEAETKRSSRSAAASDKGKVKQAAENETEIRRSSRTAAASAKGKMKASTAKKQFGSKEVDRSLYGKRDYASKNPLLSPILESAASSVTNTPTHPHPGKLFTYANADSSQTTALKNHHEKVSSPDATAGLVAAAALWRQRFLQQPSKSSSATELEHGTVKNSSANEVEADVGCVDASGDAVAQTGVASLGTKSPRGRRSSERPAGRRRSFNARKAKRLSGAHESETGGELDEERTRQTTGTAGPLIESAFGDQVSHENSNQSESSGTSLRCESAQEDDNTHPITAEQCSGKLHQDKDEEPEPKTPNGPKNPWKSPRVKSTAVMDVNAEEPCQHPLEANHSGEEEEEKDRKGGQELTGSSLAAGQSGLNSAETLGDQNEPVLESWQQANFNIDDVLKPVVKSRGSVRRSLRNRRSMDVQASGLAWVDHTSPRLITASRRRTRGRLSAVFQAPAFLDTEEAQAPQGE